MSLTDEYLIDLATPGVEVVTTRLEDGRHVTKIHGGRLDGETFLCHEDHERQHEAAVMMARLITPPDCLVHHAGCSSSKSAHRFLRDGPRLLSVR